ncbi:hypothetical protein GGI25_000975 [Coemansia spiralis]|uniref:Pentacotripeptide-repeat region of PRORP domain-containing protein n=2 Tax=Coemansia TaxID=4863 RepID=A0A9W8GDM3_9FUNG|nr:hypothetical protein EDC05_001992 [Coemansia umbellata]KAJ2623208.1 hypothetical protein GGI26_002623 [Coemansia sp. RSA 1358]KAJ2680086.1 hypothetical protein GGI25_000975 [Coemansia spiralis]
MHASRRALPTSSTLSRMMDVYNKAIQANIAPDQYTYQELIAINTDLLSLGRAQSLLEEMIRNDIKPTLRPYRTLLKGYSTINDEIDNARRLWESIKDKVSKGEIISEEADEQVAKLDLSTFTCIVAAECNAGAFSRVVELLDEMKDAGIQADIILRNTILGGILRHKGLDAGLKEAKLMEESGFILDNYTYNSLILAAVKEKRINEVKWLLEKAARSGIAPSGRLVQQLPLSPQEILGIIQGSGYDVDMLRVYNTLIKTAIRRNEFNQALGLVGHMRAYKVAPNTVTYTYLLDALNKAGRADEAEALYKDAFKGDKLIPDMHVFGIMIDACGRAGNVPGMFWYKKEMERFGLLPTEFIYNTLLSGLSRLQQGGLKMIMQTMDELTKANPPIRPTTRTLNAVYASFASKAVKSYNLSTEDLSYLRTWYAKSQSIDYYVPRDKYTYALVIEAFSYAGCLEDAMMVYSDMVNHSTKDPMVVKEFTRSLKHMAKLIQLCIEKQHFKTVLDLLRGWKMLKLPVREETLRVILFAHDQLGQPFTARDIMYSLLTPPTKSIGTGLFGSLPESDTDRSDPLKAPEAKSSLLDGSQLSLHSTKGNSLYGYKPEIVSASVIALYIGIAIKHGLMDDIMPLLKLWHSKEITAEAELVNPILSLDTSLPKRLEFGKEANRNRFSAEIVSQLLRVLKQSNHEDADKVADELLTFVEENFPEAVPV